MGTTTDRLVADISEARDVLERDLRALQVRLKREVNPRVQARRHPWIAVGVLAGAIAGAVVAGFLFAKLLRS
jgi:hypothetical protein